MGTTTAAKALITSMNPITVVIVTIIVIIIIIKLWEAMP